VRLLTELLSYELPENQAWRSVATEAPLGQGDLIATLVLFIERRLICYATALPFTAGSLADREPLRRHQALNRERGSGPQLALQATVNCLRGQWAGSRAAGVLDSTGKWRSLAGLCVHPSAPQLGSVAERGQQAGGRRARSRLTCIGR
jgi:hypothetical protein